MPVTALPGLVRGATTGTARGDHDGKLVVSEFVTLDGIIDDPGGAEGTPHGGWSFRFPTPDGQKLKWEELQASDVQLLGRVTYEGFAAAWPGMEEATGEYGKKMNGMPKVVVSTTLTEAAWNNTTIISGDVPAEVAKLREQYDGDVLVLASAATGAGAGGSLRQQEGAAGRLQSAPVVLALVSLRQPLVSVLVPLVVAGDTDPVAAHSG
jgi:dihydrofolate reductase